MQRAPGQHADSEEAEPCGYIWVTSGSLVVGACACCGRWCDDTKILKSDLRLLLSAGAAFRTHSVVHISAEEINVYAMPIDTKIGNEFVVMWETQRADQSSAFTD